MRVYAQSMASPSGMFYYMYRIHSRPQANEANDSMPCCPVSAVHARMSASFCHDDRDSVL